MCQIEVSFICSIGIFSDRETLELLTVSLSYENLLPRLTFTCFCFVCGTVPHVFIYDYRKCRRLPEPHFFLLGECHPLSNVRTATHVLQFSSGTVPLNFVWLSHNALSLTINLLIVSFSFIHYPCFVSTATPFCLFSEWNCPTLLCVNVTQMPCVSSPLSLCECHPCASSFSLCECHTNIHVSPLLLSGHSALFPFRSWLTHSLSNLLLLNEIDVGKWEVSKFIRILNDL